MPKTVVTGGAGFIGSHLVESLLERGHDVIVVDNFITGRPENLKNVKEHKQFKIIEHDITTPLAIKGSIDFVYNLACPASPIDYQERPVETLLVCAEGTKNMLDLAVEKKARFLHTSTSEVYGDPTEHPQSESYYGNVNCIGPRSCYDEGKRYAESLIINYEQKYALETRIIRIFNTYGPRMRADDGRVIPNFINQALNGESMTVYGDGSQTRSFCYVEDMIKGMIGLMEASDVSGPVNWGNPQEITIKMLTEKILELTKSMSTVVQKPLPKDDPVRRCPDITKGKAILGFEPKINLEEGLKKTISYFT